VLLRDTDTGYLHAVARVGADTLCCSDVPPGVCLCGRAAASGEIIHAGTIDERHELNRDCTPHGDYCVPLRHGEEILGVLNLHLRENDRLNEREEDFLRSISFTLATVIAARRAEESAERQQQELLRLASFPENNPFPIIETTPDGRVTYTNPAAREQFCPESIQSGDHQLIKGMRRIIAEMEFQKQTSHVAELQSDNHFYELHLGYYRQYGVYRAHVMDVSARHRAERLREHMDILKTVCSAPHI
jgi:PAS domain-containing protein